VEGGYMGGECDVLCQRVSDEGCTDHG